MPAYVPLYQQVLEKMSFIPVRITSIRRLALLSTGIIAAKSTVISQLAKELLVLGLTNACCAESIQRRLRRTLNDTSLTPQHCYQPVLKQLIPWQAIIKEQRIIFLIVDESSKQDQVHLFRVSLAYWGGSIPVAWAVWRQNEAIGQGQYWAMVDAVFAEVAAIVSEQTQDMQVVVLADRAYDTPPFIDRIKAYGWHFAIRLKAKSSLVFADHKGRQKPITEWMQMNVASPGRRWKSRGLAFKKAGWRKVSIVAIWTSRHKEPLVVLTDLNPKWEVTDFYDKRFWVETGFRNDKSKGFRWEDSQVKEVSHNQVLLLAMAWAALVVMCLGVKEAMERKAKLSQRVQRRHAAPRPQPAKESIFTMGLWRARGWLYGTIHEAICWLLPQLDAISWTRQWYHYQSLLYIFKSVRS